MKDFNIELAEKVLGHVKLHPWSHHQFSGDACMLGWTNNLYRDEHGISRIDDLLSDEPYAWDPELQAAHRLGMNPLLAKYIWGMPSKFMARQMFAAWLRYAKVRKWQIVKASAREEKRTIKRMAKAEERYQKALDKKAREQARAAINAVYDRVDAAQAERRRESVNA